MNKKIKLHTRGQTFLYDSNLDILVLSLFASFESKINLVLTLVTVKIKNRMK